MKHPAIRWIFLLASSVSFVSVQAAVTLEGTRVIHDAGLGRDVTVKATNTGTQPAMTQVWIDRADNQAPPEQVRTPFRLTPSEPRLVQAQQGQAYRITYAPRPSDAPLPQDRESLFYFNLLDIPPKPAAAAEQNLLQFAVHTRIKLFHRPAGLPGHARDAAAALRWTMDNDRLHVTNSSAYHVTLTDLVTEGGLKFGADMIAPYSTIAIPIPETVKSISNIRFTWLDDYGAQREAKAVVETSATKRSSSRSAGY